MKSDRYTCDACGQPKTGSPAGGVVTRDGVKTSCSAECHVDLLRRSDKCALGELQRLEEVRAQNARLN
jgi:hypothetical protein